MDTHEVPETTVRDRALSGEDGPLYLAQHTGLGANQYTNKAPHASGNKGMPVLIKVYLQQKLVAKLKNAYDVSAYCLAIGNQDTPPGGVVGQYL